MIFPNYVAQAPCGGWLQHGTEGGRWGRGMKTLCPRDSQLGAGTQWSPSCAGTAVLPSFPMKQYEEQKENQALVITPLRQEESGSICQGYMALTGKQRLGAPRGARQEACQPGATSAVPLARTRGGHGCSASVSWGPGPALVGGRMVLPAVGPRCLRAA